VGKPFLAILPHSDFHFGRYARRRRSHLFSFPRLHPVKLHSQSYIQPLPPLSLPPPLIPPFYVDLRRRQRLESLGNLWLPAHLGLAEDLRRRLELLPAVQQHGADDDLVAHDGLVVVDVRGAVGAVVAIDGLACSRDMIFVSG